MRIIDIIKNRHRTELRSDFKISEGKASENRFTSIFVFAPLAVLISCLLIVLSVIGLPSTMNFLKDTLNNVIGFEMHESAPEALFDDIKSGSKYYDALVYLKKNGVLGQDSLFRPEDEMKRGEFMKLVVNAKRKFPLLLNYNNCFKDVKSEDFAPAVCWAKDKNLIKGYPDHTFRPYESLNKVEILKILIDSFEVKRKSAGNLENYSDVPTDAWFYSYVQIALDNGLLSEDPKTELFKPEAKIWRGYTAQILYRILLMQ